MPSGITGAFLVILTHSRYTFWLPFLHASFLIRLLSRGHFHRIIRRTSMPEINGAQKDTLPDNQKSAVHIRTQPDLVDETLQCKECLKWDLTCYVRHDYPACATCTSLRLSAGKCGITARLVENEQLAVTIDEPKPWTQ